MVKRPPKPVSQTLIDTIPVRLSPTAGRRLRALAKKRELPVSILLRMAVSDLLDKEHGRTTATT